MQFSCRKPLRRSSEVRGLFLNFKESLPGEVPLRNWFRSRQEQNVIRNTAKGFNNCNSKPHLSRWIQTDSFIKHSPEHLQKEFGIHENHRISELRSYSTFALEWVSGNVHVRSFTNVNLNWWAWNHVPCTFTVYTDYALNALSGLCILITRASVTKQNIIKPSWIKTNDTSQSVKNAAV